MAHELDSLTVTTGVSRDAKPVSAADLETMVAEGAFKTRLTPKVAKVNLKV